MEPSVLSPIGAHGAVAAHQPLKPLPEVARVAPGDATTRNRHTPGNATGSAHAREAARALFDARHRQDAKDTPFAEAPPDPDQPTGPPPAFQITLLEVESDLQNMLARIEAARSQERQADWISTAAPEAPAAGADLSWPGDRAASRPGGEAETSRQSPPDPAPG